MKLLQKLFYFLLLVIFIVAMMFFFGCGKAKAQKRLSAATSATSVVKDTTEKKVSPTALKCPCEGKQIQTGAKGGRYCMVISKKSGNEYKKYLKPDQCL